MPKTVFSPSIVILLLARCPGIDPGIPRSPVIPRKNPHLPLLSALYHLRDSLVHAYFYFK